MVDVIDTLRAARIVPVLRHHDPAIVLTASEILVESGVTALELTTTIPGVAGLIADLRQKYPSICIGAGTVITAEQAAQVLDANAQFVVSPCWSGDAARLVLQAGIPYLPGAMTPGEVLHHAQNGAAVVKVFPADAAGGAGFLKALKSVFPDVALMPTGGVSSGTVQSYLDAGAICVGMGGGLLPAKALETGNFALAREQINAALSAVSFQISNVRG